MTLHIKAFEAWVVKGGGVVVAFCSIYSVAKDIVQRSPEGPGPTGFLRLSSVLILGACAAIAFGILWAALERLFGWNYGAGGNRALPQGWSAVALSLSLTVPLIVVPIPYQAGSGIRLLDLPVHWKGGVFVVLSGAVLHLLMYGTGQSFIGLRRHVLPPEKRRPAFRSGITMELLYALGYFSFIALPYRLIVEWPNFTFRGTIINRTALPAAAFFSGMSLFIGIKPESLRDRSWIQVRGIVAGIYLMGCLSAGMFG